MKDKKYRSKAANAVVSTEKNAFEKLFPFVVGALVLIIIALAVAVVIVKSDAFGKDNDDLSAYAPTPINGEQYSEGSYTYVLLGDGGAMITGLAEDAADVELIIPSEIGGKRVTAIDDKCFYLEMQITRAVIPEGVTYIGKEAFYGCVRLETLSLPSTLSIIRESAFASCDYLDGVSFGGTREAWSNVKIGEGNSAIGYVLTLG